MNTRTISWAIGHRQSSNFYRGIGEREAEILKFAADRWDLDCCCDNGTFSLPEQYEDHIENNEVAKMVADCFGRQENEEADEEEGDDYEILPDADD